MRLDSFIMPFFGHCISWETNRTLTHKAHTMSASQLLDQQRQNQERYQHQQRNQHRQQQQQQQEQLQSWQQQQQQGMTSFAATHHTHGGNAAYSSGQGFTQGMDMSGILNHTAAQLDWHNATPPSAFSPSHTTTDTMSFMYDAASSAASGSTNTSSSGTDGVDGGGVDSGGSSGMYGDMLWDDIRSTLEDVNAGWLFSTPALRRAHRQRKQARAAAAGRRVRATQREYGSAQQTTYYHQLSRFVDDVQALSHATDGAAAQDGTASAHATPAGGGSASHAAGMASASALHAAAGGGLGPRDAGGLAAVLGSAVGAASVASGQAETEAEVRDRAVRKESVLSSMDEELEASIANLSFIEGVYAAAGLPKRTPHSDWRY